MGFPDQQKSWSVPLSTFSAENINLIAEGLNNFKPRQVIDHCKEECLSFIQRQRKIQAC